jgi:hypothetical protein
MQNDKIGCSRISNKLIKCWKMKSGKKKLITQKDLKNKGEKKH